MMTRTTRPLALYLFAIALLTPFGCKSADSEGAAQSGAGISEPLTMLPEYQARAPRKCAAVTKPPTAAQATVMVQCTMDGLSATGLGLIQDVKLEMGSSRPFVYWTDAGLDGCEGVSAAGQLYGLLLPPDQQYGAGGAKLHQECRAGGAGVVLEDLFRRLEVQVARGRSQDGERGGANEFLARLAQKQGFSRAGRILGGCGRGARAVRRGAWN